MDGTQRPNLSGNPRSQFSIRDIVDFRGTFFNESAFSDPGDQQFGNSPRYNGNLRGQGVNTLDFSLFKNFQVGERKRLQLRAESFNLLNRVQFGEPNAAFGSDTFGQISSQANSPRRLQMGVRFEF
jgi:hypothetical protein